MKMASRACLSVLLLIPLTLAWAQDDPANRRQERRQDRQGDRQEERTRQPVNAARDNASDNVSQQAISQFATLLAIKNQEEIELARWASEKTQNDEVRQFSQKLVEDHTQMLSKLQQFNPNMEIATLESSNATPTSTRATERGTRREERREDRQNPGQDQPGQDQPGQDQPGQEQPGQDQPGQEQPGQDQNEQNREARRGQPAAEGTDTQVTARTTTVAGEGGADQQLHLRVAQESARRCLEMTKEKLGSKDGQDFDRCFIGGQIFGHVAMISKMQAQQQFASGEYSQLLEQGIQKAQEHLKHAETLAQKLESQSGAKEGAARKSTGGAAKSNREGAAKDDSNPTPNP